VLVFSFVQNCLYRLASVVSHMISVAATGVLLVCIYSLNGDIFWCPFSPWHVN